jgi:hypothetical protein
MTDREMLMMELEIRELEDRISYQEDLLKIAKQENKDEDLIFYLEGTLRRLKRRQTMMKRSATMKYRRLDNLDL